jgi:hypothetical protein
MNETPRDGAVNVPTRRPARIRRRPPSASARPRRVRRRSLQVAGAAEKRSEIHIETPAEKQRRDTQEKQRPAGDIHITVSAPPITDPAPPCRPGVRPVIGGWQPHTQAGRRCNKSTPRSLRGVSCLLRQIYFSSSDSDACSLPILLVEIVFTTSCVGGASRTLSA